MFKANRLPHLKVLAAAFFATLATQAAAGLLTVTDTTAGEPTWNRPIQGQPPNALSGLGVAVPYDVTHVQVDLSGFYTFQSTATAPAGWDNYLFLYQIAFNPASPLVNGLIGNDDNPGAGLAGFIFNLTAGVDYFVVLTGYDNPDQGAYRLEINSTTGTAFIPSHNGTGNHVPEPSSLALVGLAIAGLGAATRRRKA